MEPNLAVSIYVRSSIKFLHFVPFHQQIWLPRAILVSDWLLFKKIFSSETAWQNGAKLGRKHLCKILYKASSFGSIRPTNMATKINSFFWLANRPVYYYVFAVFTTLFYSKLRPTIEPDYSTLEQTSFFQNSFVQKGTYRDWSLRET
jgi:hypothetical protein